MGSEAVVPLILIGWPPADTRYPNAAAAPDREYASRLLSCPRVALIGADSSRGRGSAVELTVALPGELSICKNTGTRQVPVVRSVAAASGARARQVSTAVPDPALSKIPPSAS